MGSHRYITEKESIAFNPLCITPMYNREGVDSIESITHCTHMYNREEVDGIDQTHITHIYNREGVDHINPSHIVRIIIEKMQ